MQRVSRQDLESFERLVELAAEFHADALDAFANEKKDKKVDFFDNADESLYDSILKEQGIKHVYIGKPMDWFVHKLKWSEHELSYTSFRKEKYRQALLKEAGDKELTEYKLKNAGEEHWVMESFIHAHRLYLEKLAEFSRRFVRSPKVRQRLALVFYVNRVIRGCERLKEAQRNRTPFKSPFRSIEDFHKNRRRSLMEEWFGKPWDELPTNLEQNLIMVLHVAIENELADPDIRKKQKELYDMMVSNFERRARESGEGFQIHIGGQILEFGKPLQEK